MGYKADQREYGVDIQLLKVLVHEHNARYLATKREKLGHTLPENP